MPQKPWLTVALFCESVLREDTGVFTIVRITEKLTVRKPRAIQSNEKMTVDTNLFLTFRTEQGYAGTHTVGVKAWSPDAKEMKNTISEMPITFVGGETTGANAMIALTVFLSEEGLYWIEVSLDREPCARVPLRIVYAHEPLQSDTTPQGN